MAEFVKDVAALEATDVAANDTAVDETSEIEFSRDTLVMSLALLSDPDNGGLCAGRKLIPDVCERLVLSPDNAGLDRIWEAAGTVDGLVFSRRSLDSGARPSGRRNGST